MQQAADRIFSFCGPRAVTEFMPAETKTTKGPKVGWIMINPHMQVIARASDAAATTQPMQVWGVGRVFAAGDCAAGNLETGEAAASARARLPTVPKNGYAAEQNAVFAARNIKLLDGSGPCSLCLPRGLKTSWYPWGVRIFALSLGPRDGCVGLSTMDLRDPSTARLWARGQAAVAVKELITTTKVAHCRGDHRVSRWLWYVVHHWPIHCWGYGPCVRGCCSCGDRMRRPNSAQR